MPDAQSSPNPEMRDYLNIERDSRRSFVFLREQNSKETRSFRSSPRLRTGAVHRQ
jgi:hypothetical protein